MVHSYGEVLMLGLDGSLTPLDAPDWTSPAGFLPDGRLLVYRTVQPINPNP